MRKFMKLIVASLVCTFAVSSMVFAGENASNGEEECYKEFTEVSSSADYGKYQLKWDFDSDSIYDLLSEVDYDGKVLETYSYDERFLRTSKVSNGVTSSYVYDENCNMITALEGENELNYFYDFRDTGSLYVKGFELNGDYYEFLYDNFIIDGIIKDGDVIARYAYGANYSFDGTYIYENNDWVLCEDSTNVANINKVRYVQAYYDEVTGWYYMGRYYDPELYRYIDGYSVDTAEKLFDEYGPEVYLKVYDFALPVTNISLCREPVMNKLQVVTRVIYAEAGTAEADMHAVAWVVHNRAGNTVGKAYDVVTNGEFSAYDNGSYLFDYNGRNQSKWEICYNDAYKVIMGKEPTCTVDYINTQTQFRSINTFKQNYSDGNNTQTYNAGGNVWYIYNVAIPGVSKIEAGSSPNYAENGTYNIYFNIVGE